MRAAPARALLLPLVVTACSASPAPAGPPASPALASPAPPTPAPASSTTPAPPSTQPASPPPAASAAAAAPDAPRADPPGPARVLWAIEPVDNTSGYRILAAPGAPVVLAGENQPLVTSPDDLFVQALADDGAVVWHRTAMAKVLHALSGAADHFFVATEFSGNLDFQGVRANAVRSAAMIAKLDASGALVWGRTLATPDFTRMVDVAATPDGGVAAALGIFLPAKDGPLAVRTAGSEDAVVVKYDDAGRAAWTATFGWAGYDEPAGVVAEADGSVVVAGTRWKSPDNWSMALADNPCHGWIAKLGPGGEKRWIVDLGTDTTRVTVSTLAAGSDGAVVVAGMVRWRNRIGGIEIDGGPKDRPYVAGIDGDGKVQWVRPRGAAGCIAVDAGGRLVIAGPSGVSIETPAGAGVEVLPFEAGAVEEISSCRLDGARHLYVAGVATPKAKIGDKVLQGAVLKRPRTSWLHPYRVGFVAKIAL